MTKLFIGKLRTHYLSQNSKISRCRAEWCALCICSVQMQECCARRAGDNECILYFPRHSVSPFSHSWQRHGPVQPRLNVSLTDRSEARGEMSAAWRWRNCNFIIRPSSDPGNKYVRLWSNICIYRRHASADQYHCHHNSLIQFIIPPVSPVCLCLIYVELQSPALASGRGFINGINAKLQTQGSVMHDLSSALLVCVTAD